MACADSPSENIFHIVVEKFNVLDSVKKRLSYQLGRIDLFIVVRKEVERYCLNTANAPKSGKLTQKTFSCLYVETIPSRSIHTIIIRPLMPPKPSPPALNGLSTGEDLDELIQNNKISLIKNI